MGWLERLWKSGRKSPRRGAPELTPPSSQLAFVLLPTATAPTVTAVLEAAAEQPGLVSRLRADPDQGRALQFTIAGVGDVMVALAPMPIPGGEAEAHFELSVCRFAHHHELGEHAAHLIVALPEASGSPRDGLECFTQLLAALVRATSAVGVYWGDVFATHSAEFFVEIASDPNPALRMMLWNGVSRQAEDGGRVSLLSLGMGRLGLPDLLVTGAREHVVEALQMFFDLLSYVAQRGEPIPDGDTIGVSATDRHEVRYVPSPADSSQVVWRIDL